MKRIEQLIVLVCVVYISVMCTIITIGVQLNACSEMYTVPRMTGDTLVITTYAVTNMGDFEVKSECVKITDSNEKKRLYNETNR